MTVKLESLTSNELLVLTKRYFMIGCLCLPLFWFVNLTWSVAFLLFVDSLFNMLSVYRIGRHIAKTLKERASVMEPEDTRLLLNARKYSIIYSSAGCLVWLIALITWISIFAISQTQYPFDTFDAISVYIPKSLQ